MNIEQLQADLPNGFHDALLRAFTSDPAAGTAVFTLDIWLGDLHSRVTAERERYRPARLELLGLVYLVAEEPDLRRAITDDRPLQIDACAADDAPKHAGPLPPGAFAARFFVTEWNSCIHFAALDANLTWIATN